MATQKGSTEVGTRSSEAEVEEMGAPAKERLMRADARRNRALLVAAAHDVFSAQGASASMEAIAKEAGVGVGTLYRHFPNRLDLVEAVYETDVHELVAAAQRVVAELGPWEAVEAFFDAFLSYTRTKQALMSELQQAFEKHPEWRSRCREQIEASFDLVIDRAKGSGVVRNDVSGADIMQLMAPICTNASIEPPQQARLLGMILDGMRAEAARTVVA